MTDQDSQYFSKEGLAKLKSELDFLKTARRKEIAERLEYAKSLGDLSENSEYQEAKESQLLNEGRIAELEDMLRRAVVVEHVPSSGTVDIGSKVFLEDEKGARLEFNIVGLQEAAPSENKISHESPLGRALLGHRVSETVKVETPKGSVSYKIIKIN